MKAAEEPKDVQHIQFKQSTPRVISNPIQQIHPSCNQITTDCKRGLIYIAHENKITVLPSNATTKSHLQHSLPFPITRISLSCDYSYLSVTFTSSTAHIYNATSLCKPTLELLHEIQFSTSSPTVFAYDLKWNPAIPGNFCTIASDYTLGSFSLKTDQKSVINIIAMEKIQGLEPTCVAWSPKGKQIVVGCKNGSIIQLKPELKVARSLPGPSPSVGEALAILWISNYQFCAAYSDPTDRRITVVIIDAPKGEATASFTNYEDITFGMPTGDEYRPRYYFEYIPEWNLILAASSDSVEVAVLGSYDNGANWCQWLMTDSERAALPTLKGVETYPLGLTLDKTPQNLLPWGETSLPQPTPILHIFSTSGSISSFHMINLTPNCPSLCSAPWEPATLAMSLPTLPPTPTPAPAPVLQTPSALSPPAQEPSRMSLLPAEISFALNSAATSTPRAKPSDIVTKPQIAAATNLFQERMKSVAEVPSFGIPPVKPAQVPAQASQVGQGSEAMLTPKRKSDNVETVKQVSIPQPAPEQHVIDEALCIRVYKEEEMLFEGELKQKLEPVIWECGTEEEKQKLITQSTEIESFLGELKDTTNSLTSDISYLKGLLLQSFTWIEETKSRNSTSYTDNPRERYDRSKIKQLERLCMNTQSQLIQATKALDMDWAECQLREKSRMKLPSLEFVYQSLKRHAEIIAKEKSTLQLHVQKWKSLTRSGRVTNLNRSMSKLSLAMPMSSSSAVNGAVDVMELRCKAIASNVSNFNKDKQMKLREALLQTKTRVIKPINPSPVQDRLEATLSSLASLSPVPAQKPRAVKSDLDRSSTSPSIQSNLLPSKAHISAPTISQSVPMVQQVSSPLASLNSIVSQIGASELPKMTPSSKPQPFQLAMGSPFSFGFDTLSAINDKLGQTPPNVQEPKVNNQIIPSGNQLPPSFTKARTVVFGTESPKPKASVSSFSSKEQAPATSGFSSTTPSLFSDALFKGGVTITKSGQSPAQPGPAQVQPTFSVGSVSISLKDPPATQSVFSFANPPAYPAGGGTAATTSVIPGITGGLPAKVTEQKSTNQTAVDASTAFGKLQIPSTTLSFGKVANVTPVPVSQPVGTLEKQSTPTSSTTPAAPIFGSTGKSTGTLFGGQTEIVSSMFGGGTSSSTFGIRPQAPSEKPPEVTVTAISQSPSPATTTSPTFGSSAGFGAMLNNDMSNLSFGKTTTATSPVSTASPIFGTKSAVATSGSSLFGQTATTTAAISTGTTTAAIFGQAAATTAKTSTSMFGQGTSATTAAAMFGRGTTATTAASIFGQSPATTPTTSATIFGKTTAATATTSASVFEPTSPATPTTSASIFGQSAPATPTTSASIFSQAAAGTPTTSASIFGQSATPTTSASIFSQAAAAATPTTSASIFGQSAAATPTTSASIFGQAAAATPTTSASIFGQAAVPTTSASIFGKSSAAATAPGSIFGQASESPAGGTSMFGGGTMSQGQATNSTPGGIFGSPSAAPNNKPMFGMTPAPGASIFGGGAQAQAQPESGSSIFGSAASSPFGAPTSPSIFGGAKPQGTTMFGASTFGTPVSPSAAPAFGGAPAFGAKAVFGSAQQVFGSPKPEYGASAFGSQPTFGSPGGFNQPTTMAPSALGAAGMGKVFGSPGNSTFESLAGQNGAMTFGGLAQKSPEKPPPPAFSGGSSFSSWR